MSERFDFKLSINLPYDLRLEKQVFHGECDGNAYWALVVPQVKPTLPPSLGPGWVGITTGTGHVHGAAGAQMPGELIHWSSVAIVIPIDSTEEEIRRREGEYILTARSCLNHFLCVYRAIVNDPLIRPLSSQQFSEIRSGRAPLYQVWHGERLVWESMRFDRGFALTSGGSAALDPDTLAAFRAQLASGHPLDAVNELMLEAESWHAIGFWRLVVVDASAALDLLVKRVSVQLLIKEGKNAAIALSTVEKKNTVALVESGVVHRARPDVECDSNWKQWRNALKDVRNAVIHEGRVVSSDDARQVLDTVRKLVRLLSSRSDFGRANDGDHG